MSFEVIFFWGGLALLLVAAWFLKSLKGERTGTDVSARYAGAKAASPAQHRDVRPAPAAIPRGFKLIRSIRRGSVEVAICLSETAAAAAPQYIVAVNQNQAACGDCNSCLNEAISWIQQRD